MYIYSLKLNLRKADKFSIIIVCALKFNMLYNITYQDIPIDSLK